jgi:hypothetical protein
MNNIDKLKNSGFTICCYIQRGAKLSDKQNSFVNEILSYIENDINSLFKQFRHGIDDDLFSKLKDNSILNYLNSKGVKNPEYLRYCNFSFDEDEYAPKDIIIDDNQKDEKIFKLLEDIKLACKKVFIYRPTITYIDKDINDFNNVPKSRFTGEYPTFKVSSDTLTDDIYFIIGQHFDAIKDYLEYFDEDFLNDYPFYTKKYLEDLGFTIDENGNIIDYDEDD